MRLSIRLKVLATYFLLAVFVLAVLFTGLSRLKRIGTRLNIVQNGYMPLANTVNSLFTFYSLQESFDAQKIIANRHNRLFVDSTTLANPQWMETQLQSKWEDAKLTLLKNPSADETRRLHRIHELMDVAINANRAYTDTIRKTLDQAKSSDPSKALALNEDILSHKRLVRSRVEFLARQLDERIRNGIRSTVIEERNAVFWTVALTTVTLLLAAMIGFIVLFSLKPLRTLKDAARKIAEGDLHRRVEIQTEDEVGDLAREFNKMANAIEQRDEALHRQQEQLIQTERMAVVGRMASKISHEVRNPLNALSLNIEMLSDEIAETSAKKSLAAMSAEIDRLNRVAENYLSMARAKKEVREETDISALARHLELLIRPEAEKKKIHFEVNVTSNLPKFRSDPVRLEQALLNLLRNAMEASREGGAFGMEISNHQGTVQIHVWDDGKGIDQEILPHIFEPFYTTKDKGTGLGLSITREIIQDQGGSIHCKSSPGKGTRFELTLPTAL